MPLLLRTCCQIDWKGRPNHRVVLVAKGEVDELVEKMNKDVIAWMIDDILAVEMNDDENEDWDVDQRAAILGEKTPEELREIWKKLDEDTTRMEMNLQGAKHREFSETLEGDTTTTVYHFLQDDLSELP